MSSYGHLCFYLLAIMGIVKVDISVTVFFSSFYRRVFWIWYNSLYPMALTK